METQLPHLKNPHKIKKIRQDETEIQNPDLGNTCPHRLVPLWWKSLALAGRTMAGKIHCSVTLYHHTGNCGLHIDLPTHHRGNTLVTHFLNRQIYEKKNKTIAQQCRYYEVDNIFEYMVSIYLNGNISAFGELYKELNRQDRREFITYLFSEVAPIHIQEIILATV